ncbi:MAG: hypothetical protein ACI8SE_001120 [Bacteroidia bacterium]|jgi:hypothetical protein
MDLIIEQPTWFILLCLGIGLIYSLVLYRKSIKKNRDKQPIIQWVLAFVRFLTVFLLALLVLNPLLKYIEKVLEKPVVFIQIDQSQSMTLGSDSAYVWTSLNSDVEQFTKAINSKYDVVILNKQSNKDYYNETSTDLSKPFLDIQRLHDSRSVAGMVLVSDGIYNVGANPNFSAQRSNFPIYTVPVGDTTVYRDVSIYSAKANAVTFLGNQFPVEVVVNAVKASGQTVELSIWQNGAKLDKHNVTIQGSRFTVRHTFLLDAKRIGNQAYTIRVSSIQGEINKGNNSKLVYTDVLDVKQKILVAAHAPHPDVAVLRNVISGNDQYELDIQIGFYDKLEANKYDLVITHQLPVNSYESNFIQSIKESKTPLFSILGSQTNIDLLNRLDLGLEIKGNKRNFNQGLAKANDQFALFDPGASLVDFMGHAPPLTTPFGEYVTPPTTNVLAFQKIGSVETQMPLWSFNNQNDYRIGICAGEGLWRWKFYDYETNESFNNIDVLLRKTIQYLALKDDKRKFKVYTSSKSFFENDRITFIGEVYNDSYEFTPEANVQVTLNHSDGTQYTYALVPQNGAYRYAVGSLPVGSYNFSASAQYNGKKYKESGSFVVKAVQLENQNLTADHDLLRQMAKESGGQVFSKESWGELSETLLNLPNAASIVKENSRYKDLISQKWLFFLLMGMLSIEWFARRWLGGY